MESHYLIWLVWWTWLIELYRRHGARSLLAMDGATNLVTSYVVKSLQFIWRWGTRRCNLRVPDLQMSCSDLISRYREPPWWYSLSKAVSQIHVALDGQWHLTHPPTPNPHPLPSTKSPPFRRRYFRMHFANGKFCSLITFSLRFVPNVPMDNYPALV